MRKVICLFLSIVCVLQSAQIVLAAEANASDSVVESSSYSFLDAEGKENTLLCTIYDSGEVVVESYVEGQFVDSSQSVITNEENVTVTTTFADGTTDVRQFEILSQQDTIADNTVHDPVRASIAHTYAGKVTFNGHNEGYAAGSYRTHTLKFYESLRDVRDEYKTLNAGAGTAVSAAVGAVISVLALFAFPPSGAVHIAEAIVITIAMAAGSSIVGGVLEKAVSGRYYVRCRKYDIKVTDPDSGKTKSYYGEEFQAYVDGGGYSSEVQYSGKRTWWTTNVLTLIWPDFFTCGYPGVSSIIYA